ncbi:hypothetical protein [Pedobacter gandavensis]|uniref:hypothetical protein n=1 Tax=Pedobacter gandavensis TaxID=2679963 RepID=UPI00292F3126|nr:hypothetical protein [Pedobacter gandavensis]
MLKNILNKSLFVVALIAMAFSSGCKKDIMLVGPTFASSVSVAYSDKQGNDYLKAQSPENIAGIKLYHLIDGKKVYYNKSDNNNVGKVGFHLIKPKVDGEPYKLSILLPIPEGVGTDVRSTAYLLWENGREDEIVGSFDTSYNKIVKKFWYNKEEADANGKKVYTYIIAD